MMRFSEELKVDVVVVGCVGRKGPKVDMTVLGSTADYSLRQMKSHTIVMKHNVEIPPEGPMTFVVGIDSTEGSSKAFDFACSLARKGDTVVAMHIWSLEGEREKEGGSKLVEEVYLKRAAAFTDFTVKVAMVERDLSMELADNIAYEAWQRDAQLLCVGVEEGVGHIVSKIIKVSKVSTCVIKM